MDVVLVAGEGVSVVLEFARAIGIAPGLVLGVTAGAVLQGGGDKLKEEGWKTQGRGHRHVLTRGGW